MKKYEYLITPDEIRKKFPVDTKSKRTVNDTVVGIKNIFSGKDNRKLFFIGPCSIHNIDEALDYAKKLNNLREKVKDKILVIMRAYFEKPRTGLGWEGLIDDPDMDGKGDIKKGIFVTRKLLLEINKIGLPCATEFLDFLNYPYTEDLISFGAIGARTSESQPHREMVSGMDVPVGFKNSTDGDIEIAINSIIVAGMPQHYIGVDYTGKFSNILTSGNKNCVLILRGGSSGPNYKKEFVAKSLDRLNEYKLQKNIIIDCSHGNSEKSFKKQISVFDEVVKQMKENKNIRGLMMESYLKEGNQPIPKKLEDLEEGISVTDECISWEDTERLILSAYDIF